MVATEGRQQSTRNEAEETNIGETTTESPLQTLDPTAGDHNASTEAPASAHPEAAEAAHSTAHSEEARETKTTPVEGDSSHADEADGGGESNAHKGDVLKAEEGELGLPFVATDIALVTCRSGEKVRKRRVLRLIETLHSVRC